MSTDPADASFTGQRLVMDVRQCTDDEIRIPFHVGKDRSRTWVISRTATGLRLKHDHRHEDGTSDALTMYGGDSRGQQSSALLVVQTDGGYAGMSDTVVELRVEDHELPIEELRRIYTLHDEIFGTTPERFWLPVDDELAAELRERLAKLGYEGELEDSFIRWTGKENLEDRVDGFEKIDPVVLEALRNRT